MFVIGNAFPAFGLISTPSLTDSLCGSGAINDLGPVTVLQVTKHIGSTLNFIFQMSASNTGIRNINILIGVNDITADLDCIIADPLSLFSLGGCSCPLGQYMSAICTPCDDACENCYGGDASSCYSCNDGYYFNGASCLKCDDSCETCSGVGPSACLTCPWGDPADANSECNYVCDEACATCSGPYSNMCDTCNDGYYFDSPSSCLKCNDACGTCDDAGSSACLTCPWGDPADTNSECIFVCDEACNSCSGPYSNTCDICNDGYYFESSSSCLKCDSTCATCSDTGPSACLTCSWGALANTNSECLLICDSSCDTCFDIDSDSCSTCKDGYYLAGISSCLKCDDSCKTCSTAGPSACLICPSGDPSDANFQCLITSSPPEPPSAEPPPVKISTKRITKTNNITQTMVGAGLVANTILKAGNSGTIRISMLAQMIEYIKYLNIDYPYDVQYAISYWDGEFINFNSDSLDLTPNSFENYGSAYNPLPSPITMYDDDIDSSFLMNFWDDLFPLFILSGLLLFMAIFEVTASKTFQGEASKKIIRQLKICLQGLFITYLYDNFGDVFFFAILSYRTIKKTTALTIMNILVSILFIAIALGALIGQTWIVRKYQTLKNKDKEVFEKFESKIEGVKVLWKDFKDETFFQMNALFVTVLHNILFCIIITALTEHPLAQVILMNILSLAVIAYLLWFQPFDEKQEFIQTIACEALLFVVNICLLILISLDSNSNSREHVGQAILVLTLLFNFIPLFCLAIALIELIKKIYHITKAYLLKRKLEKLKKPKMYFKKSQVAPTTIELIKDDASSTPHHTRSPDLVSANSLGLAKRESVGMNLLSTDTPNKTINLFSPTPTPIPGPIFQFEGVSDLDDQFLKAEDPNEDSPLSKVSRSSLMANRQQNLLRNHREYLKSRRYEPEPEDGLEEI